ncbi:hypothetical protein F3F93_11055 [Mariprofundus sp. KV]|nr:hypothetical protein [Mariprofundus sp. KV]
MSKPYTPFANIRYCGAKARSTGKPCRGSAMHNGRCRLHGGASKGRPVTSGKWTKESLEQRKKVNSLIRETKGTLEG